MDFGLWTLTKQNDKVRVVKIVRALWLWIRTGSVISLGYDGTVSVSVWHTLYMAMLILHSHRATWWRLWLCRFSEEGCSAAWYAWYALATFWFAIMFKVLGV